MLKKSSIFLWFRKLLGFLWGGNSSEALKRIYHGKKSRIRQETVDYWSVTHDMGARHTPTRGKIHVKGVKIDNDYD